LRRSTGEWRGTSLAWGDSCFAERFADRRGKTLTLWVNGAVTCQFPDCGQEKGRVGVEGEGFRIEYRNLKVKELR